ncbi:MAG: von Willebrand factor type A domain-containing protein [Planctomycetota bacterium]|nr:von Willebrand factor type A domain-containing protein [Planctomycetota bacterium]
MTDYLLGELNESDRQALEESMASDPEMHAYCDSMKDVIEKVKSAKREGETLSTKRRNILLQEANPKPGKTLRFPMRMRWAAAAVVIAGAYALMEPTGQLGFESETSASAKNAPAFEGKTGLAWESLPSDSGLAEKASSVADSGLTALGYIAPPAETLGVSSSPAPSAPATAGVGGAAPPSAPTFNKQAIRIGGGAGGKYGGRAGGRTSSKQKDRPSTRRRTQDLTSIGYSYDSIEVVAEEPELEEARDFFMDGDNKRARRELTYGHGEKIHGRQILRHIRRRPHESPRAMFFRYYGDHAFVKSELDALSTFAADVDTASWALARNYLNKGYVPPKDSIRTEEFLNWLEHDFPAPTEGDFAVSLRMAPSRYGNHNEGVSMLQIGVKGREISSDDRKPFNLVFVIDRSGSMKKGNRMEMVKRSLELLVDQLRDDDTVGIVSFESNAHLELESTSGKMRWKIREAVRNIEMGGSTNAEAGLLMGYEMAERAWRKGAVNRVILCSDGVANTGETDQERILEKVRAYSEQKLDLTTIGVGLGNHNDVFLERLANKGNGTCHYVDDYDEAKRVFVERFTGTLQTIARDVKIQVEFNPGIIKRWRQLGYENRAVADEDFRNDAVDAGEVGAGHSVTALYELESHMGVGEGDWIAKVRVRWFADGSDNATEQEWELSLGEGAPRWELASRGYRRSAVAAQFAEFLRRSYWVRGDSFETLLSDAKNLVREDPKDEQARELRDLIQRTLALVSHFHPPHDDLTRLVEERYRLNILEAEVEQQGDLSEELHAKLDEIKKQNDALEEQIRKLLEG